MTKPLIQINDEVREMTDEEFAEYQIVQEKAAEAEAMALAKATAKADVLERLGLTAEEAALLLG